MCRVHSMDSYICVKKLLMISYDFIDFECTNIRYVYWEISKSWWKSKLGELNFFTEWEKSQR